MKKGLLAHSDGDVALHALTDALLGAAALGDIGKLFPDTDPAFKGADSRELLREAWRRIQARGYALGNVDITIIAQAPKMLPHIPQMRVFIAEDLGCHMDDVKRESDHHREARLHRPRGRDRLRSGCAAA
ncbi:2-C-methyl-D-erythritol 2,4-cyclo diphosphate synthase [Klebsiella pneumoniae]|uniref:2-C-methyl-D-erythritol 2,4-cyclodiphosphate synthase n=1 Tax=Klebsiella pneumoniae TaxID=573 RepID=A0A3S4GXP5_KLEPN|nr:2-C-methyl-D-erythritol 2,4-cyclo diphosphate synthase [Klebsiella pneumoniae]